MIKNVLQKIKSLCYFDARVSIKRVQFLIIALSLLYGVIIVRLFGIALFSNQNSGGFSLKSTEFDSEKSKRFSLVDRDGRLIAVSLDSTSVYANTKNMIDMKRAVQKLKVALPKVDHAQLLEKLQSGKSFVWIKRNITPQEHQAVHDLGIPGIYFQREEKRAYPYADLLAHVVGYVGLDGHGLSGVEKYLDENSKQVLDGSVSVNLSIDTRVQNIVRDELNRAIKDFNAKGGMAVLMDVNTGEVISLVSLPDYNPYHPHKATEEELFNKATLGNYEVGSIFKIFSMAMALDSKVAKVTDVYDVDTPIQMAGYSIKDFRGKKGWLSLPELLMYSSNIGISQVALELGKERQVSYLNSLGFFDRLGLELQEKATPHAPNFAKWRDLDVVTASYGYTVSTSPVHLVRAMSAVVNGGRLCPVTILKQDPSSMPECKRVLNESTSETMKKILRMVVKHGMGSKADVPGYFIGGKTGTSHKVVGGEYRSDLRLSSFLSAFPINNPKYAMLVTIDEPKGTKESAGFATGGWVAAPATARIVKRIGTFLNLYPEVEQQENIEKSLYIPYNPREVTS